MPHDSTLRFLLGVVSIGALVGARVRAVSHRRQWGLFTATSSTVDAVGTTRVAFKLEYLGVDPSPGLLRAVELLVPEWPSDGDAVHITQLTGGTTNLLWKLTSPSLSVLVRVYGVNTEVLINREMEVQVLGALSKVGVGPKLYGCFDNGRIEGFFEASRSLQHTELGTARFPELVAKELARLHALCDMPVSKAPQIWTVLDEWLIMALKVRFPLDPAKQAALDGLDLKNFASELAWLKTVLPSPANKHGGTLHKPLTKRASRLAHEVVFCHNDANAANVLYLEKEQRCQLIDFEYSQCNYRAFDLANTFVEFAGFDCDVQTLYPTRELRHRFLTAYVHWVGLEAFSQGEIEELDAWANKFALASHAMWFLWAIIHGEHAVHDIDFIAYAQRRRDAFSYHRALFF